MAGEDTVRQVTTTDVPGARDGAARALGRPLELRRPTGDERALPDAAELFAVVSRITAGDVYDEPGRVSDRTEILAAAAVAGDAQTRALLEIAPCELVSAALGLNRAAVLKRVKNNALAGIAAFGMLPLAPGESVLDRYLQLREVAKRGPKLGPHRRHSHAAAIEAALAHLAQVAGYPDADRLEWDCEARIAGGPTAWQVGDYSVSVTPEAALVILKDGRPLRSVPAAVRKSPSYAEARACQDQLRDQARRMRTGLLERLVATEGTLTPEELGRLLSLPAGASMLPALLWRDAAGVVGRLADLSGPVTAVHPVSLADLPRWQRDFAVEQPVEQLFREVYRPGDALGFAGRTLDGRVAVGMLSSRGWDTRTYEPRRTLRTVTAILEADVDSYWAAGPVTVQAVRFIGPSGEAIPAAGVPPIVFSEIMRDVVRLGQAGSS